MLADNMKGLFAGIFSLLVIVIFVSCQRSTNDSPIDVQAVKAEISTLEDLLGAAITNRDLEGALAYYAEDAQSMPQSQPTLVGKNAIRRSLSGMMNDTSGTKEVMTVVDVWAAGDLAVEVGTFKVLSKNDEVIETGKYMSLFEKRDGKYVCVRDIYNTDDDPYRTTESEE